MSRDLILIAISMFTWGLGESTFVYFQPLYLQKLGASPVGIGAILGGLGIAMTIAHIPAGYLADRIGQRPLLWLAWAIGSTAAWVMALAPSLTLFVAGLLLYGISAFVMSPLNSYVTAVRGRLTVGRALTLISASYSLGAVIGPQLGGLIGERWGLRQTYLFAAFIFLASTLFILFIRAQSIHHSHTATQNYNLPLDRGFIHFLGVIFIVIFATYLPQPLSSNFLQNQRGLSLSEIGSLGSIASFGIVVLNLALGLLDARLGFLLGQMAMGVFSLLLWQANGFPWYAAAYFFLGGYRTTRALAVAQTRRLVQQGNMGLAYGIFETVSAFAVIIASILAGLIYARSPSWVYAIGLGLISAGLLTSIFALPTTPANDKAPL